jgi:hypothetical protein
MMIIINVNFALEQAMKAQVRGEEVYVYSFFNLGARWGWVVNATPRPLYPLGRDPVPIVEEVWWLPGSVWTDSENLALTDIRSPERPAHS